MFTALALAVALSAPMPKGVSELKWQFTKGDTFYVRVETDTTLKLNPALGPDVRSVWSRTVLVYQVTVTAAEGKSTAVQVEFLSCVDSTRLAPPDSAERPEVAGKKGTITLDADHTVTRADGLDKVGAGLRAYPEEYLKSHLQDLFRAVPGKPLRKGDTWTGEAKLAWFNSAVVTRADRGTVAGTEEGLLKLEVESDYAVTGGPKDGVKYDLKAEKGKRAVLFDPKSGRVRTLTDEYTLTGTVSSPTPGGVDRSTPVNHTQKVTLRVTDDKPKDEK